MAKLGKELVEEIRIMSRAQEIIEKDLAEREICPDWEMDAKLADMGYRDRRMEITRRQLEWLLSRWDEFCGWWPTLDDIAVELNRRGMKTAYYKEWTAIAVFNYMKRFRLCREDYIIRPSREAPRVRRDIAKAPGNVIYESGLPPLDIERNEELRPRKRSELREDSVWPQRHHSQTLATVGELGCPHCRMDSQGAHEFDCPSNPLNQ